MDEKEFLEKFDNQEYFSQYELDYIIHNFEIISIQSLGVSLDGVDNVGIIFKFGDRYFSIVKIFYYNGPKFEYRQPIEVEPKITERTIYVAKGWM